MLRLLVPPRSAKVTFLFCTIFTSLEMLPLMTAHVGMNSRSLFLSPSTSFFLLTFPPPLFGICPPPPLSLSPSPPSLVKISHLSPTFSLPLSLTEIGCPILFLGLRGVSSTRLFHRHWILLNQYCLRGSPEINGNYLKGPSQS